MLAMKFFSLFFLTITGEIPILPAYVRSGTTVRDHDCYLKSLTLTDETRLGDPHTLLFKEQMIWQDYLRLSDSHLTCTVESNSLCLFSHEDVYIFQFQQATIFTATILFQPQLITTMYMQLQMIKYINCQFVVLHTCTQTLFHTRHIREMQEIFRSAHNNKKQYFIEPFLIRSVRWKRNHVWRRFLCSPLILSRLTTAVIVFCLAVAAGMC